MSSSNPPFRQRGKQDPVDAMLDEWRQVRTAERPDKPPADQPGGVWPPLSQLEMMLLLLKRP